MLYLPEMANDGGVGPCVLRIQTHGSIFEHDEVEGLIKPPGWRNTTKEIL